VGTNAAEQVRAWLAGAVVAPFRDLLVRNGPAMLIAIGLFIVLFKFGDAARKDMEGS